MGQLVFVAFEPREDGFIASVPMEELDLLGDHPELLLQEASQRYKGSIDAMRSLLADMAGLKRNRTAIPARKMWELGDNIFDLREDLSQLSLELEGLYEHLVRDLKVNGKRLGTIITFRRYLPHKELIPESLGWSQCEKGARKVAESLSKG